MKSYDLCVAGGGFAGVAAALRASRLGLKTLLIEKSGDWGGTAREARHETLCGLYTSGTEEPVLLNSGIPEEIEQKLLACGAQKICIGKVWVLEYRPKNLRKVFSELLKRETNLEVLQETLIEKVSVQDEKITGLTLRSNSLFEIGTRAVIDCTGNGTVIRLSGALFRKAPAEERQLAACAFQVHGAGPQTVDNLKFSYAIGKAAGEKKIEPHLRFSVWIPGENVLRISVLASDSVYDLAQIRKQAMSVHEVLKQSLPEFSQSQLGEGGPVVERDGLRLGGKRILIAANVHGAAKSRPGAVKSSWPMEFWHVQTGPRYDYVPDGDYYEIPEDCYRSKDISNLFAAGKCISADPKALSSARMSGTCLAMGEKCAEAAAKDFPPQHTPINIVETIKKENAGNENRPALRFSGKGVTYRQLFDAADAFGRVLKNRIPEYARVGIAVREGINYVALHLAVLSIQAVVVPVPETSSKIEIEQLVELIKLDVLIFDPSLYDTEGEPLFGTWKFRAFHPEMKEQKEFEGLNPAFIRFTSGTTGQSKGVVLSHEAILARTDAANEALQVSREDKILWVLSMSFHFVVTILLFLRRGAEIILCGHEIPQGMTEGAGRGDVTFIYASPVYYQMMLNTEKGLGPELFRKVRLAISTALPLPAGLTGKFSEKFGFPLTPAYGIIEAGLPFVNTSAGPEGSVGKALPGFECQITEKDENGTGLVQIQGPGLYDAYFNPWKKREKAWFQTDDVGRQDENGFLFLLGRRQRVINFMGMKIFPEEIEQALELYPKIAQAYVYGEVHAVYGQTPTAKIVLKNKAGNFDQDALRAFCYARLPKYKVPKQFECVTELTTTKSGKVSTNQKGRV